MMLFYPIPPIAQQSMLVAPAGTRTGDSLSGLTWYPRILGTHLIPNKMHESGIQFDVASNLGWHGNAVSSLRQDNEMHRLRVSSRRGGPNYDTTLALEGSSRNGGFMDPLVRFWHSSVIPYQDPSLGVPPDGRHDVMWTNGGDSYSAGKSGWQINRFEAGIRVRPSHGVAIGAAAKLPLSTGSLMERGGVDVALTASCSRQAGAWQLTWEGQRVVGSTRDMSKDGVHLTPTWGMQAFHAGRMLSNRWSFGLQYEDMDAGYGIGLPWSGNKRRQMTFTVRTKISSTDIGEVSVSENVRPFRTTPYVSDVIFALAVRRLH